MKKILTIVLALMLIMACTAVAESHIYISVDSNVRTGPGLGYSKIGIVAGDSMLVYAQDSTYDSRGVCWYKVQYDGGTGWVASTYSWPTNDSGTGDGSPAMFWFTGSTVLAEGDVNLRSGPGLSYAILDTMLTGETASYLGSSGVDERGVTWYNVEFDGQSGWVSATWATLTGNETDLGYVAGTSGDSNVRTGPGLGYSSFGCLNEGETADYLGSSSVDERGVAWYNISFDGQSGWVSSRYTTLY